MGQKVNPISFRLKIVEDWSSRWYAKKKHFGLLLVEDFKIRRHVQKNYRFAGIPKVEIERAGDSVKVILHTARPGIIIGRGGKEVDRLRDELETLTGRSVTINIRELSKPELSAQLVAEGIGEQLAKRTPFRRVMRKALETTTQAGAEGIKIAVAGRLGGSEMARRERVTSGMIPLHTLRAKIDYGYHQALTSAGTIGVKVWIYTGRVWTEKERFHALDAQKSQVSEVAER